ncbi:MULTISPECIES: hypothetical protein [Stenotrophomonas]|uniref:Uncharacterized protein n=2 Tax=Stenotrophomonas TaxID=40323 RepID=A0ABR5NK98_9GAMM|nr:MULTISPECIES: hypothetical protein [Stenotrophomonas]KQO02431.1 hypothetical protein ASF01_01580 [Stenotrophomonas sp. Leaf70]KRG57652.1 hypothetical protein ABB22_08180 [Stenotrophomonas nitritireducens]
MNRSEPLTPEERELARLLGRPAADLVPSARIDAAIAALVREPAASTPAPRPSAPPPPFTVGTAPARRGRRRGLVSSLAAAASLVLVVGLAWQLRPMPPSAPVPAPAAATAAAPEAPAAVSAPDAAVPASPSAATARPAPPPPAAPVRAAKAEIARPSRMQEPAPAAVPAPSPARAAVAPAPPPAPPAPVTYTLEPAPMAADAAPVTAQQAEPAAMRLRSSAPQPFADAPVRASASGLHEQAKSTVMAPTSIDEDARLPRRKWLERIRSRRDNGDLDSARASLERFVLAYPETRIPRDLQPLLAD